jgi:hypothetical protein
MQNRRFTRLTNAFSKKAKNHAHAVSLFCLYYNYCRPHQSLTKAASSEVLDKCTRTAVVLGGI